MGDLEEALKGQRLTCMKSRRYSDSTLGSRSVRRPEEIARDVRGLKARRRVSLVLQDEILREDLEDMTKACVRNGSTTPSVRTYQDFLIPTVQPSYNGTSLSGFGGRVLPINDLRGDETLRCTKAERLIRCKLASFYRVVDYYRWSYLVYNHITVRAPGADSEFLIKPFGLLDGEATASSLIKIDLNANVIDEGSTSFDVNVAGFNIHSAIYEQRPNAKCIVHIHYPAIQAVASMKCGVLRVSQEALLMGKVSYLDYGGLLFDDKEKEELNQNFPTDSKVLMLRNHGALCVGDSIEEAFQLIHLTVRTCETQVKMMPVGIENMYLLDESLVEGSVDDSTAEKAQLGNKQTMSTSQMEWESAMRSLDGLGYCTGYIYRVPDVFVRSNGKKIPESQVPPTSTGLTSKSREKTPYDLVYEIERGHSVQRSSSVSRANTYRNRVKWLNSPIMAAQYQKEREVPPAKMEEPTERPVVNGVHKPEASDVFDREERNVPEIKIADDEKKDVATPTANNDATVTETTEVTTTTTDDGHATSTSNVIKMVSHKTVEVIDGKEVIVDDSHVFVNGTSEGGDSFVVVDGDKNASLLKSPEHREGAGPSENGSHSDAEGTEKSPKKVKKQKSFKAFMKKVGKK